MENKTEPKTKKGYSYLLHNRKIKHEMKYSKFLCMVYLLNLFKSCMNCFLRLKGAFDVKGITSNLQISVSIVKQTWFL